LSTNKVEIPGTYSGEQEWNTKTPKHGHATIELSKFQKKDQDFVLGVNTWNHLLGDENNNTKVEMDFCNALPCGEMENCELSDFVVRKGSRAEVDGRFKGIMTSVSTVMTPATAEKLGKRVF